jgi:hypothetical protein
MNPVLIEEVEPNRRDDGEEECDEGKTFRGAHLVSRTFDKI